MASGGYRPPAQPAAVAGPGRLSRRTDGGPADRQPIRDIPNARYGEQAEFRGIQQSAPIREVPSPATAPSGASGPLPPPLDAPSARPEQPVTFGANAGDGPGMDALGLLDADRLATNDVKRLLRYLPAFQHMVDTDPSAHISTRALVRFLRSQV